MIHKSYKYIANGVSAKVRGSAKIGNSHNLKGVTVRPCTIWEVTSVVNKKVRHEGQTIQEFI